MARKKISEFNRVVPNSEDRIIIEQNGMGRSAALSSLPVSDPTMEALNDVRKDITKVYKFKGTVANKADLPTTDIVAGDAYNVSSEGKTYAYNGSSWVAIGVDAVTEEVLQAREGYDGTIYSDLGTAIRTQVSNLKTSQDQVAENLTNETSTRESEIAELERVNAIQKYEIENLKAKAEGRIYRTEVVEAEAYSIDVPSSVAPYAEVQKIGGKSVVWNQLAKEDMNTGYYLKTAQSVIVNSTILNTSDFNSGKCHISKIENGHSYYLKITSTSKHFRLFDFYSGMTIDCNDGFIYTNIDHDWSLAFGYITSMETGTYDCKVIIIDLTQMFGPGNKPDLETCKKIFSADYYPYDEGTIKSFPVKRVKSVGRNLLKTTLQTTTKDGLTCTNNGDGTYTFTGKVNSNYYPEFYLGEIILEKGRYIIPNQNSLIYLWIGTAKGQNDLINTQLLQDIIFSINEPKKLYITIVGSSNTSYNNIIKPMLTTDLTATYDDFVPYVESTLDVSSVTSGLKSASNVHDEWNNGKLTKRIGVVDLGTLGWIKDNNNFWYTGGVPLLLGSEKACISNKLSYGGFSSGDIRDRNHWYLSGAGYFEVYDDTATSSQDVKNDYSGVILYYELKKPTEEVVPEIDNYIEVEGGGTLTFESDETIHMPVPSTDRFIVDLT